MADAEPMSPVSPKSEGARSMTDSEMDRWVCAQCEGVPTVPKKSGPFAAFKEVMRICAQTLGLGLDAPIVVTKDFYELTGTHISGEIISLEKFRGKVTLCVNVASKCGLTNKNYAELGELCQKLQAEPFEVAAFPCNQFGWQEPGEPEAIRAFVSRKLEPFGVDFTVFGKVNVNGPDAHPIWQFLRYNAKETGRGSKILPVPWNFGKFLVDQEGRVVKYFGPGVSTATIEAAVKETLAGTKKGRPPREPTKRPDQAPAHFRPVQFQAAEAAPATE